MKKVLSISIALIAILVVMTGCEMSRTAIDAETFKEKAEAADLTVQDSTAQQEGNDIIDEYYIAYKGSADATEYQIEFVIFSSEDVAKSDYLKHKNDVEALKGSVSSSTSAEIGNYAYYTLTTDGKYYVISRVDNTLVYVETTDEHKSVVSDFIKGLGY